MKQENDPKKLASLLKKLKPREDPGDHAPRDPVAQLVMSFLNWETTTRHAEQAFDRLMAQVVDINELRVTFEPELIQIIGPDYPLAAQRLMRMREALNEVYLREHDVKMHSIADKGKREQRAYLDSLPATPPYVAAQVTLLSFGGHAMPVDTKLAAMLSREGVIEAGTTPAEAEAFLLRNIKADDAVEAHLKLQGWADESRVSPDETGPTPTIPQGRAGHAAPSGAKSVKKTKAAKSGATKKNSRRAKKK